jgi:hypothetical protein
MYDFTPFYNMTNSAHEHANTNMVVTTSKEKEMITST